MKRSHYDAALHIGRYLTYASLSPPLLCCSCARSGAGQLLVGVAVPPGAVQWPTEVTSFF